MIVRTLLAVLLCWCARSESPVVESNPPVWVEDAPVWTVVTPRPQPTAASRTRRTEIVRLPEVLKRIRGCESGNGPQSRGDYRAENAQSSASGAYQFLDSTWRSVTGTRPPASSHSRAAQDAAALKLYRQSGTSPWRSSRSCWFVG